MGTIKQNQDLETTWIIDTSNDTYKLGKEARITTSGEFAVEVVDGVNNNDIVLKGDVTASGTTRVVSVLGNGHQVTVARSAHIDGTEANVGIFSNGADFSLDNAGTVEGDSSAISVADHAAIGNTGSILSSQVGISAGDGLDLTNSGKIDAGVTGVMAYADGAVIKNLDGGQIIGSTSAISLIGDGDALIKNAGLIMGQTAIYDNGGDAMIINKGIISGNVNLGDGDDTFNTKKGKFEGEVNGGDGNDTYIIGKSGTYIVEQPAFGYDTVKSTASFTLDENLEDLTLLGKKDIDGTGNAGNNVLTGNKGDNVLMGMEGEDYLQGGKGNDTLFGGAGEDMFDFRKGTGDDVIEDFVNGEDLIFTPFGNDGPSIADLIANHATAQNGGVLIAYGDDSLFIKNMSMNQLDESDFFSGL